MTQTVNTEILETIRDHLSDALVAIDDRGRVCLFNAAAEDTLGIGAEEILDQPINAHRATRCLVRLFEQGAAPDDSEPEPIVLPSGKTAYAHVIDLPDQGRIAVLQRLHQSPSQFMNLMRDIVHDLKIPIASAKGFVDLVGAAGDLTDRQAEFVQRALGSLDTMLARVHELLDMAWLETGGDLSTVPTDLVDLVRQTVNDLEPFARRQKVHLNLDLPDRCPIHADERRLMSAIYNLISNAIKYSPDGGPVDISVGRRHDGVIVRVEDHGLGIEPEHLPHIFQRFYRIHTPRTQRIEGSGLGLEIAQAIIEKHGGDIHVQSQPDEGSVFWFRLPAAPTP
jgi:two-component system, OmpR family, phosphate regulon sensor histidine kinase PhoR